MSKIDLQDVQSLTNEQSALDRINQNSALIETKSDTFLSRDGTSPNQMETDLDLNSNRLINPGDLDMIGNRILGLDPGVLDTEAVSVIQLNTALSTISAGGSLIKDVAVSAIFDGNSSPITTGIKGEILIPFDCVITAWYILADQSGSIVIDIWKSTYAGYPPTVTNTITASAKPTLSSVIKNTDTLLTGWTKTVSANDTIRFNVDSASTVTRVELILKMRKTT